MARAVISNGSPILTYSDLVDPEHVPAAALRDLTSRSVGLSATTLYMGLDCPPEAVGMFEPTSMIGDGHDIDEQFRKSRTLEPPGFMGLTCYNHADPTAAPPGASNCSLIALQYADPWLKVAPEDYAATKYAYADAMLTRAERVYPGIRGHIEEAEVATPLTSMRYLNTPGGSIYGFDLKLTEHRLVRQNRSFIDGLYHTGTWVTTQGFQPTLMGGTTTARRVMRALQ
jgi:prolycopene isomerase